MRGLSPFWLHLAILVLKFISFCHELCLSWSSIDNGESVDFSLYFVSPRVGVDRRFGITGINNTSYRDCSQPCHHREGQHPRHRDLSRHRYLLIHSTPQQLRRLEASLRWTQGWCSQRRDHFLVRVPTLLSNLPLDSLSTLKA